MPWISAPAGSGIGAVLFNSTLGADTASIDTGANGIPLTYNILEVFITARTDEASVVPVIDITVNNDTGANYDLILGNSNNGGSGAVTSVAQTKWAVRVRGNSGGASYPGTLHITIPAYAATTFFKSGQGVWSAPDQTAANGQSGFYGFGYRATTAISRMAIAAEGAAKLRAGSQLLILGR